MACLRPAVPAESDAGDHPGICLVDFLYSTGLARLTGWKTPAHTDLAVYFGRCLSAFILTPETMVLRAALSGESIHVDVEMLAAVAVMMVIVHIYSALRRIQPLSENRK
ncbi:hypothetical protein [uncultured Pseudomonas sp.]|uniref:hypothetical protein n=1 Tax=uncultured Pseudomonas sp. TaxID=114707 RepID=UPI0026038E3B|nr:hypothetical protein [uncultured Pseudomonas sp.]